ncbi:MAG: hypothetical protein LQ347_005312 [Umbilicaria vellea]|nr:MAG: hypothetical protein LQ347_005312 [Umbilicaria vellea]
MPYPCATARYEIYRLCYLELAQSGIIAQVQDNEEDTTNENSDVENHSPGTVTSATQWHHLGENLLPKYDMMQLYYFRDRNPNAVPRMLWDIAEKSDVVLDDQGLSGRTLRRLPALAIAMYTTSDPCPIEEALAALSRAVEDERNSRMRSGKEA